MKNFITKFNAPISIMLAFFLIFFVAMLPNNIIWETYHEQDNLTVLGTIITYIWIPILWATTSIGVYHIINKFINNDRKF